MSSLYVHGYDDRESERLSVQAGAVATLVHDGISFRPGARVLEVGCGTGAQTLTLALRNPHASIVSVDHSASSLAIAKARVDELRLRNVEFHEADITRLPFAAASFDAVFVCFVLEHLSEPDVALRHFRAMLRHGGELIVFEGDHGSVYFHPDNADARAAIACQSELQRRAGGNAEIGRALYPLLRTAGFRKVIVAPRTVYVDGSRPDLADQYTKRTFTPMIEGVRQNALDAGLITASRFDAGIRALYRAAAQDGVFCYTFFSGRGRA
jgi:ubiquinone/menaquinone biosynthesis C-methylase UbiE